MRGHMRRNNWLNMGNIMVGKLITAERLGVPNTEEDLLQIVRRYNYENVLVNLCRINLIFHRSANVVHDERILKDVFCKGTILSGIDASTEIMNDFIFSRQGTLRMLDKCACYSDPESTKNIDTVKAMNDFAKAFLIINGLLDTGSSALTDSDAIKERNLLVNSIPFQEYATNDAPQVYTKHLTVRSKEFLRLLQEDTSNLDVNNMFYQHTGLKLQEYQNLIFLIFTYYWNYTAEEIRRQELGTDKSLFFNPNGQSDEFTPLYQKLIPLISVSIDDLKNKAEKSPKFIDEFRLWRDRPILQLNENRLICVDFNFFLDKLHTGAFWLFRQKILKDNEEKGTFERLWGDVFEDYAASVIKRGLNSHSSTKQEKVLISPEYNQKRKEECADVAVCSNDTLVLFECKSTILSAECKFSHDFNKFYDGCRSVKKGIEQLGKSVQKLGNLHQSERKVVDGIDICKIKKIYPVLVLSDRIFSGVFMNDVLDSEFQEKVQYNYLMKHLQIMPLTVLTIYDLELLEPYIQQIPLYVRLDEWLEHFQNNNRRVGFNAYLYNLINSEDRSNQFMDDGFAEVVSEGQQFLLSHGIS